MQILLLESGCKSCVVVLFLLFFFTQALYCGQYLHVLNALSLHTMLIHFAKQPITRSVEVAWELLSSVRLDKVSFFLSFFHLFVCVCLFFSPTLPNFLRGCFKMLAEGQKKNVCEVRLQLLPRILPGMLPHDK